jgi:hypothetical protein
VKPKKRSEDVIFKLESPAAELDELPTLFRRHAVTPMGERGNRWLIGKLPAQSEFQQAQSRAFGTECGKRFFPPQQNKETK